MMPVPPLPVRRVVIAPGVVLAEVALLVASPLLAILAALASPVFGGWRPVRMLVIAVVYAYRHLGATLACLGLWLTRRGRHEAAHYRVMRWFVSGIHDAIVRIAHVEVRTVESGDAERLLSARDRPVLVLSVHAGEGDSLLVLHRLLCRHGRRPRIVMHEALRLDPLIDVLGERLPNRFVDPRGGDTEGAIAAMAAELDPRAALIIFPEGTNFSPQARQRAIERLERAGLDEEAQWAREMKHLSAPRPGGALAAIAAAPVPSMCAALRLPSCSAMSGWSML